MVFVNNLTKSDIKILKNIMNSNSAYRTRQRAHAVILSHKQYPIDIIADIFGVSDATIRRWLELWVQSGLMGLYDAQRPGRPHLGRYAMSEEMKYSV
jgi:predicted ArsR family transcriptional regulator